MKGNISFPHETHILVKFITILCKSFFSCLFGVSPPQRLYLVKGKTSYKYEAFHRLQEDGWERAIRNRDLLTSCSQTLSVP